MKPCQHCSKPIPKGPNYAKKKYCGRVCYVASITFTLEQRRVAFWKKVDKSAGPEACWTWRGAVTSKHHYGCFQMGGGRVVGAHKVAWLFTNGDPGSLCVLHRCDNRVCVNPAHLFLGTKQDNGQDMSRKGRSGTMGEKNPHCLLTEAQVRGIIMLKGSGTEREIAKLYGVKYATVGAIWRGATWKHLPR